MEKIKNLLLTIIVVLWKRALQIQFNRTQADAIIKLYLRS